MAIIIPSVAAMSLLFKAPSVAPSPPAPVNVVNPAYDTSGNGGRKIVRLSNGWIVTVAYNSSNKTAYLYVSKDNGQTWSQLCYLGLSSGGTTTPSFALASSGTNVYLLSTNTDGISVWASHFDATTQTNTNLNTSGITVFVDNSQSSFGSGCSLAIDGTGALHATWCSKNSTYPNSFNIRYSKSTDGGNTWATPTQISTVNNSNINYAHPCIVVTSNNYPIIIVDETNPGADGIVDFAWNGTSWINKTVYVGNSYTQSNPCAVVDNNDVIHVVWHGTDSTDTAVNNIRYSKSSDGGSTWTSVTKLTSGNSYTQADPSISIDSNNNLYVFFEGTDPAVSTGWVNVRKIINTGGTWGSVTTITNNTTAHARHCQTLWSKFNMNSSDAIRYMWRDDQAGAIKYGAIPLSSSSPSQPINSRQLWSMSGVSVRGA